MEGLRILTSHEDHLSSLLAIGLDVSILLLIGFIACVLVYWVDKCKKTYKFKCVMNVTIMISLLASAILWVFVAGEGKYNPLNKRYIQYQVTPMYDSYNIDFEKYEVVGTDGLIITLREYID